MSGSACTRSMPGFYYNSNSQTVTRHRASTSMYWLTFCIRVMLPERHQWKPAVQAAAVMLRMPPVDGQSPASQPHNFENAPVTRQSATSSTRRPRRALALCRLVAWSSGRALVFGRCAFAVLRSTCSWWVTTYRSAIGQPTRPTQPLILSVSINE